MKDTSTRYIHVRVTPEEEEGIKALAAYLGESYSEMLRRLAREERARLVALGKRPPRRLS